nr:hypothetical protein BaRGS_016946 [Batillaria attramentaria]
MNDRMVTDPKKAVYLNPVAAERAFVIKNQNGDWAFVVGTWKGFKNGVPGVKGVAGTQTTAAVKGTPGKPGSPGTLLVRVWICGEDKWETIKLPYTNKSYTFKYRGLEANLKTGDVKEAGPFQQVPVARRVVTSAALSQAAKQRTELAGSGRSVGEAPTEGQSPTV